MSFKSLAWKLAAPVVLAVAFALGGCSNSDATPDRTSTAPAKSPYVNTRCPIMDSPIEPAKVKPSLVREYKGQKVAFCCAGCPATWDKLSDSEKQAKLDAAK